MKHLALLLVLAVAACGDEGGGGGAKPPPKPAAKGAKKPDKKILLNVYPKVEDRVAVNERPTIRHPFRERDFASDPSGTENRDPFRSYVITQPGGALTSASGGSVEPTTFCTRKEQMVASNYNLRDLRLVGIVTRGPKKYALFQDTGDVGRIVHRGDCLGREKARVKDIGSGFVTLEIIPEQVPNQPPRPNEERSIPL